MSDNLSESDEYAVLSYCWGSNQDYLLKKDNISAMRAGLDWHRMPATLQDAVSVTRKLGLKHLWIDALCKVQDDTEDWKSEAATMATYYENAYITIAATSSPDSNSGFLGERKEEVLSRKFRLRHCPHDPVCEVLTKPYHRSYGDLEKSTINTRGWMYQENVLSRRVACYTPSGII